VFSSIYIETHDMAKLPDTKNGNNLILTMRISKKHRDMLEQLAKKKGKFGGSASSAIRYMIEYHFKR